MSFDTQFLFHRFQHRKFCIYQCFSIFDFILFLCIHVLSFSTFATNKKGKGEEKKTQNKWQKTINKSHCWFILLFLQSKWESTIILQSIEKSGRAEAPVGILNSCNCLASDSDISVIHNDTFNFSDQSTMFDLCFHH